MFLCEYNKLKSKRTFEKKEVTVTEVIYSVGLALHYDIPMGPDTRWLTVSSQEQPDLQLVLFPVKVNKMFPKEIAEALTGVVVLIIAFSFCPRNRDYFPRN